MKPVLPYNKTRQRHYEKIKLYTNSLMITDEKYFKKSSKMNLEILKQDNTSFQKQECLFSLLKIYIVLEILANEMWQEK